MEPKYSTGEIICKYNIKNISQKVNILNEDYILDSHFSIYVNDEKIETTKSYEFPSVGIYEIKYIFYDNKINLNYMFKNIDSLISVEM